MYIRHRREQHPIGQGLFHSASVQIDDRRAFNYVYDCGAKTDSRADIEVDALVAKLRAYDEPLDAVFLSHFHEDHFNGIARLLDPTTGVPTQRIYLPLLDNVEKVIALAAAGSESGALVTTYLTSGVAGVAEALGLDGTQIIEVAPTGARDDDEFVDGYAGDPISDDVPWAATGAAGDGVDIATTGGSRSGAAPGGVPVGPLSDDRSILLGVDGLAGWEFRQHVSPATAAGKQAFLTALGTEDRVTRDLAGRSVDEWLAEAETRRLIVSDRELAAAVARAYRAVKDDINLTTLSVYSGPVVAPERLFRNRSTPRADPPWNRRRQRGAAWLGTGDGRFASKAVVAEFLAHFGPARLDQVGTLVVPHHGGALDFSDGLAAAFPYAYAVFSYGVNNTYGHPSQRARDIADRARMISTMVTNEPHTRFIEDFLFHTR